ncbi:hypothetical protein [Nocardia asiatica]|uniref:hypothetical protein n=1 Tax=Nocardia asiatica TaxID=209252 RepID=UPI0002D841D1|nr:hypothetical protein [Nocardia asiatica]
MHTTPTTAAARRPRPVYATVRVVPAGPGLTLSTTAAIAAFTAAAGLLAGTVLAGRREQ